MLVFIKADIVRIGFILMVSIDKTHYIFVLHQIEEERCVPGLSMAAAICIIAMITY